MRLTAQLAGTNRAPREARGLVRERFSEVLPAKALHDLLTIVSELVTNAFRHGDEGRIGLAIEIGDKGMHGEVQNRGDGQVAAKPLDPADEGGLGLHIVGALADSWEVQTDGITRVSFQLGY